MSNTAKDMKNRPSVSNKKDTRANKKKKNEIVEKTAEALDKLNPRDTLSMGSDEVAITREAIKLQENAENKNLAEVVPLKPHDNRRSTSLNNSNNSTISTKKDVNNVQDNKEAITGGFFSKFVCFLVVVIGLIIVFNVLKSRQTENAHVDSYAKKATDFMTNIFDDDKNVENQANIAAETVIAEIEQGKTAEIENEALAGVSQELVQDEKLNKVEIEEIDIEEEDVGSKAMLEPIKVQLEKAGGDNEIERAKADLMQGFKRGRVGGRGHEAISDLIAKKAVAAQLSPTLIASIVMAESYFNSKAVSKNGKKGLMQISAAREAHIRQLRGMTPEIGNLFDPDYNLDLGVWYVKYLMNKYDGDVQKVLLAYSWDEKTLEQVLLGKIKVPRWAGLYFANIQRYYNSITKEGRIALSLPSVEKNNIATTLIKVPSVVEENTKVEEVKVTKQQNSLRVEEPNWVKSLLATAKGVPSKTKKEIVSLIKEQSLLYGMDPAFVSAIIMAESAFNPKTTSKLGKRGLFQLEPKWAKIVADTLGVKWQGDEALYRSSYNVELGVAYLQHLKLLFDDDLEKTVLAFTLTPYRMSRILAGKRQLPKMTPQYLNNIRSYCTTIGCVGEVNDTYVKRLQNIKK